MDIHVHSDAPGRFYASAPPQVRPGSLLRLLCLSGSLIHWGHGSKGGHSRWRVFNRQHGSGAVEYRRKAHNHLPHPSNRQQRGL